MLRISLLEVFHQGRERLCVGLHRSGTMRRGRVDGLPPCTDNIRILPGLQLHPFGHIVVAAVLPCGKPQQDQAYVALARLIQQHLHHRHIVFALFGFNLLPVDRDLQRIGVHLLHHLPHAGHHIGPCRRIGGLPAQNEVRLAVHQQGMTPVLFNESGNGGVNLRP